MRQTLSDSARAHLRFALTEGVGPILFSRILVQCGCVEAAVDAPAAMLQPVHGIGRAAADRITAARDRVNIEPEIELAARHGVRILGRSDAEYPRGLHNIPDAPIVLYVKGELRDTDAIAVAIVGSRRCSTYGGEQSRRFGELLAGAGFTVVSGLARGIDAFAHHGAVDAGGRSLAVMGCGLAGIYPPENRALADRLVEHGALLSELPMNAPALAEHFPSRNRIIAGITLGTLIVEAQARSGALITARLANEYNREVFAIPGRLQEPMSIGPNSLIRDGAAKLVTCLDDILDGLGDVGAAMRRGAPQTPAEPDAPTLFDDDPAKSAAPLTEAERRVYDAITYEPMLQDVVLTASQLPPGEVLASFTSLELKGMIRRLPGQLVVRVGRA